jgi:aminopeptidase N
MKKIFIFVVLVVSLYLSIFPQPIDKISRQRTYDVEHYLIKTKFDAKKSTIFGETTITLKPLSNDFKILELDAANLKFSTVKLVDSKELQHQVLGDKIIVSLDRNYAANEQMSIQFVYSAKPKKGIYFVSESKQKWNPHSAQIWTHNEPEEAHYWFPNYDFPDDKATSEQFITAQDDEDVISNGELIEKVNNADSTTTWHFKTNFVHSTYLTSFVIGKYKKFEDKYRNVPLGFYLYPSQTKLFDNAFGNTKNIFKVFEDLLKSDFPFNKYDQTVVADFKFGGMENVTATTLSDNEVAFAEFDFGQDAVTDLVSHEISHSWFGNLVTCKNWSELWLNEGFATFMEAAYREQAFGREDYLRKIREDSRSYFGFESSKKIKQSLYNPRAKPDDSLFSVVTYQKGGVVIHMLRDEVGDEVFWNGLQKYLQKHKFGNVETKDLQNAFEESSSKNLDWFFKQWVYNVGYPILKVGQQYSISKKVLKLNVEQTQLDANIFRLPTEIKITTKTGIVYEKLNINKRKEIFTIKLESEPISVAFDYQEKIPLKRLSIGKLKKLK